MLDLAPRRARRLRGLLLLVLAGCSGNADPPEEGGASPDPAASVSPRQAPPSASVRISASGFAPSSQVEIGFGPPNSEYEVVGSARTDADGALRTSLPVPDWAEAGRDYVWVVADADSHPKAVTATFQVQANAGEGAMRVEGTITDEGVECPAMRAEDGTLFTLAGAPEWASPGDRVVVTGSVAQTSFCMQGTTIAVQTLERAG